MSKILITGGAGLVGYHLATSLSNSKNTIVIADKNIPTDNEFNLLVSKKNVVVIKADLTKKDTWKKIGNDFDEIYHLASINGFKQFNEIPYEVLRVGILSTINLLEWMRDINKKAGAKVLFTSSNETYIGDQKNNKIPTREEVPLVIADPYNPRWSYAGQKIINELLIINFCKMHNFRYTIVRPHNLYGPRAGGMIPKMIERVINKIDPFPLISPDENRSSCYIDDAVNALIIAMASKKTDGKTYNVGSDIEKTVGEISKILFDLANWQPNSLDIKKSAGDSDLHCLPDISKLKSDTTWKPEISLENGLKKTLRWHLNQQ